MFFKFYRQQNLTLTKNINHKTNKIKYKYNKIIKLPFNLKCKFKIPKINFKPTT